MNIEILNSIHGGVVLSINNYIYIKNKDYIRKIDNIHIFYWTCVKKCGAKIQTFCENNVHYIDKNCIFSENYHLHGADPISVGARKIKETIKKNARENHDKPIQIYHAAIAGTSQTINSKNYASGLFNFIKLIQKVQNDTESTVEQLIQGRTSKRAKKNVDVQNARLKCIQQRISDDDKLDKLEFLKGIAHNLTL
ncbi:unnamed protein product [Macrosiphum euphorbiae]|uniref:FLYWCH-type domain-containing protein n=1 Tax=Macrosiphum euphorbiae TaxID=13131 RepID=A0AAV0VQH4_9HEMI|nr:unnamed protein product [Macrosiphum euphorbiae]